MLYALLMFALGLLFPRSWTRTADGGLWIRPVAVWLAYEIHAYYQTLNEKPAAIEANKKESTTPMVPVDNQ